MATSKYDAVRKIIASGMKPKVEKTPQQEIDQQISNMSTRLKAGGADPSKATDKRNFIEKALNLTPDQNFLFDIFELIGRPQQALFGGIENAQQGKSFLEGAGQGFSGKKDTRFKTILTNAGMEDEKGKLDLADVFGFVGDVALDPVDLALWGTTVATGGATAPLALAKSGMKGVKTVDTISDISKGLKALDTASDIGKGLKTADTISDIGKGVKNINVAENIGDILKASKPITETKRVSTVSKLFELGGKGVKKGAGVLDKGITKGLGFLDDAAIKSAVEAGQTFNPKSLLKDYEYIKDWFGRSFNATKNIPKNVLDKFRKNNVDAARVAEEVRPIRQMIDADLIETAKKMVGDVSPEDLQKTADKLNRNMMNVKEFIGRKGATDTLDNVIKGLEEGKLKYTPELDKTLQGLLGGQDEAVQLGLKKAFDLKVDEFGRIDRKSKDYKQFKDMLKAKVDEMPELMDSTIGVPLNYTKGDLEQLKKLEKQFKTNPELKAMYERLSPVYDEVNTILDKTFGTNLIGKYGDNTGYVRHALESPVVQEAKNLGLIDDSSPLLKGKTSALAERQYKMSALEANTLWREQINKNIENLSGKAKEFVEKNQDLFSELYTKSFDDYLREIPDLAKNSKMIDDVLVKSTFGDFDKVKSLEKQAAAARKAGDNALAVQLTEQANNMLENSNMRILKNAGDVAPPGYVKIMDTADTRAKTNLLNKLESMGDKLGNDEMKSLAQRLKKEPGIIAIDPNIMRMIEVDWKKEANAFGRIYDKLLNVFKKNKVMSPTFQINNAIGNMTNMSLSGVPVHKQMIRYPQAANIMSTVAKEGIEGLTEKQAKIYNEFLNAGFGNIADSMNLRDMPESLQKYFRTGKKPSNLKEIAIDGLPYLNNKMNNYMDTMSRLAMFIEGNANPNMLKKLGVDNAGDAVRKALFDPSDLTPFEQDTMKKLIPFYTFTKKNLAFHMSNLGKNGEKYNRLMKGYDSLLKSTTGDNEENVAEYLKNSMYIPIPGMGKDGNYRMMRAQLPFGQLLDLAGDPMKNITSMTTPFLKLPFELATGTSTLTGRPIEKFEGELSKDLPFLTKKQEQIIGGLTGLDVPMKQVGRFGAAMGDEGNLLERIGSGTLGTVSTEQNVDTDKLYKSYDELEALETLMKQYKQMGYEFQTMNELKKANQNPKLNSVLAQLNKVSGVSQKKHPVTQMLDKMKKD